MTSRVCVCVYVSMIFWSGTAQGLGFPYLNPYLAAIGSNFTGGANFASAGASVLQPGRGLTRPDGWLSPFYLQIQLNQFSELKSKALELFSKGECGPLFTLLLLLLHKCHLEFVWLWTMVMNLCPQTHGPIPLRRPIHAMLDRLSYIT